MNFSAFGGPFSGIHQFAKSFGHEQSGAFTTAPGGPQTDIHGNRYHSNTNHFNQNTAVTNSTMQYGQNISIPYSQPQEHNFLNTTEHNKKNQMKMERDREDVINQQILQNVNQSWQTLANPGSTADYSSHLLSTSLPITLQHFLKYSETIKKENGIGSSQNGLGTIGTSLNSVNLNLGMETGFNIKSDVLNLKNGLGTNLNLVGSQQNLIGSIQSVNSVQMENNIVETTTTTGKKKKKKPPKEKKPRPKPGEIRETKALDGSTLYCCPECQMAYPDRSLIEQHVVSHAVERRFVCDICHAALKRKDHLTRHKLSHIPDRPHVCTICMKSFKRKEQLTLHIVIHSGEKKHVCPECGKGFYRKDHLRKHTRSHIARRVKSEVSAQTANNSQGQGSTNMHTS